MDFSPAPVPDEADRRLLAAVATGDRQALDALLQRHLAVMWRVALRLAGHAADAEDVLQEACLACLGSAASFTGRGPVRSWLLALTANAARRQQRAQQRRRHHERQSPPGPTPEPSTDEVVLREAALTALARLGEGERLVLSLRFLDELSDADIAAALGLKEASVRSRSARGLQRLRGMLARRGFAVSASALTVALSPTTTPAAVPATVAATIATTAASGAAIAMPTVFAWTLGKIAAVLVALVVGSGAVIITSESTPRLVLVDDASIITTRPAVAAVLDHKVRVHLNGDLKVAFRRFAQALPVGMRPAFAAPDGLLGLVTGPVVEGRPPVVPLRLHGTYEDLPLRAVLDSLCRLGDLRWTATSAGIVIDQPLPAAELAAAQAAFAQRGDQASADALAFSVDTAAHRVVLLALGDDRRADVALAACERIFRPGFFYRPSPLRAHADDPEVIAAVRAAIRADRKPRDLVLEIAGQLRMPDIVPGCLDLIAQRPDPQPSVIERFRRELQGLLSQRTHRDAMPVAALRSLGWMADERAVPLAIEVLEHHDDPLRTTAAKTLGAIGNPMAVAALLRFAGRIQSKASTSWDFAAAFADLDDPAVVSVLVTILGDRGLDWPVRCQAAEALGWIGGAAARQGLIEVMRRGDTDESPPVAAACRALAWVGGPGAGEALVQALRAYPTGSTAAEAIGTLGDDALLPALAQQVTTTTGDAYRHTVDAIAGIGTQAAANLLVAITPSDPSRLWSHARALAACPQPQARERLRALAMSPEVAQRRAVVGALGAGDAACIALARHLIETDPDLMVRERAIHGFPLPAHDEHSAAPLAVWEGWLRHRELVVRRTATASLGWRREGFPQAFALTAVARAFEDDHAEVRRVIVEALSSEGQKLYGDDPALWRRLVALAEHDPAPVVRRLAAQRFSDFWPQCSYPMSDITLVADTLLRIAATDGDAGTRAHGGFTLLRLARGGAQHDWLAAFAPYFQRMRTVLARESDARVRQAWSLLLDPDAEYLNPRWEWRDEEPASVPHHPVAPVVDDF